MEAKGKNGLENYITRKVSSGEKIIIVKLVGAAKSKDMADKVMQIAGQAYMKVKDSDVLLAVSGNQSQLVFEINYK
jgi:hypothetical protein